MSVHSAYAEKWKSWIALPTPTLERHRAGLGAGTESLHFFLSHKWRNLPLAFFLALQSLHFGPTDGYLPQRRVCSLWHSCALTSQETPDLSHLKIMRDLNLISHVLITYSVCYTDIATAWNCSEIQHRALHCTCNIFLRHLLPGASPRLWNSSGQKHKQPPPSLSLEVWMPSSATEKRAVPDVLPCFAFPQTTEQRGWLVF